VELLDEPEGWKFKDEWDEEEHQELQHATKTTPSDHPPAQHLSAQQGARRTWPKLGTDFSSGLTQRRYGSISGAIQSGISGSASHVALISVQSAREGTTRTKRSRSQATALLRPIERVHTRTQTHRAPRRRRRPRQPAWPGSHARPPRPAQHCPPLPAIGEPRGRSFRASGTAGREHGGGRGGACPGSCRARARRCALGAVPRGPARRACAPGPAAATKQAAERATKSGSTISSCCTRAGTRTRTRTTGETTEGGEEEIPRCRRCVHAQHI
jgi:hypothetical protein